MDGDPQNVLLALGTAPLAIALAIILMTFVQEDIATAGAALLAADGTITPALALASLFVGVFMGDLALFALGQIARRNAWVLARVGPDRLERGRTWLSARYVPALVAARFTPGMRMPTFTASGFLQLPFGTFFLVLMLAGVFWTSFIFVIIYASGVAIAEALGPWRWVAVGLLIGLALMSPRIAAWVLARRNPPA